MKLAIIGATGMAGSALYKESLSRGHEVTAIVRHKEKAVSLFGEDVKVIDKDIFELTRKDLEAFDVIINAFATAPDKAYLHLDLAAKLVAMFRETESPRLFFILGAASLLDENDNLFLETLKHFPEVESWISIPIEAYKTLNFLRSIENVNWVGVSPSANFVAGGATTPVIGKDHLLKSSSGESIVTSETMAIGILDEIEKPQFIRTRFTVCNQ
ncbi:NAD(P)-dependent oxidoreductase [Candidatus Galacturonibacter soehngenii]|uniref:NAD(P)H-binding protein n=1 Tax=Candidatus Galacturonatibacter soehngenii TaxID=2307010 RepID=A0A7V7QLT7_9FIRM|nr:NAD(P)H-binding protein [Candidatus Galacturonibacter soehngenii]KAB1439489.1 NAD(P)H-binding protein [Candidatus Galacturonibacter soehngenii]MBA4687002.1 NAD(P)H-binding protein [Candidatus Galacturonibacter soehngenii]